MKYTMHLAPEVFRQIQTGRKTVEMRLWDEKRRALEPGDVIEFVNRKDKNQSFAAEVVKLHRFASFAELYAALPLESLGYDRKTLPTASPSDMNAFYSPEEQASCGVVGIEVALLDGGKQTLTPVSRWLSLVLRHKPEAAGIALDAHGWAEVDALLAGMQKKYPGADRSMLEKIVCEDDKQRYAFSEDEKKIRANQGHTVKVDVELEALDPPEFLYHGTVTRFAASIEAKGLVAKERLYVHLSFDEKTARAVGLRRGDPVVYRIAAGEMCRAGYRFFRAANGVWLTDYVPAFYLEKIYPV